MTSGGSSRAEHSTVSRLNGVVVMLDALGMKGVWARREPSRIVDAWRGLVSRLEQATSAVAATNSSICGGYQVAAFSDTVILTLESTTAGEDLGKLIHLAGDSILEPFLIGLFEGILLRGAMTAGVYYQTRSSSDPGAEGLLTIGPAIDEAAEWYDQGDWFGVTTVPSATYVLDEAHELRQPRSDSFVRYEIPLRSGQPLEGWTLDWPRGVLRDRGTAARAEVLGVFSANPIPPIAVSKYRHSLAFFDRRLEALAASAPNPA